MVQDARGSGHSNVYCVCTCLRSSSRFVSSEDTVHFARDETSSHLGWLLDSSIHVTAAFTPTPAARSNSLSGAEWNACRHILAEIDHAVTCITEWH